MSRSVQAMLQVAAKCGVEITPQIQNFIASVARSVDQLVEAELMARKRAEGLQAEFQKIDALTKERLQADQRAAQEKEAHATPEDIEEKARLEKEYEGRTANNRGRICAFGLDGERKE